MGELKSERLRIDLRSALIFRPKETNDSHACGPRPFVGADQSHVGDWSATLEKLRALQPGVIIPGHGPVMRDDAYVRLEAELFASIKKQVGEAVARGATLEETRKSVNLDEFRKLFAGDSKVRNALFSVYVVGPAVASAFHDASEKR